MPAGPGRSGSSALGVTASVALKAPVKSLLAALSPKMFQNQRGMPFYSPKNLVYEASYWKS